MSRNSIDCMMVCKGCQIKLRRKQGVFVPPPEMTGTGVFYCSFKCWGKHRKRVNSHPCTSRGEMPKWWQDYGSGKIKAENAVVLQHQMPGQGIKGRKSF